MNAEAAWVVATPLLGSMGGIALAGAGLVPVIGGCSPGARLDLLQGRT